MKTTLKTTLLLFFTVLNIACNHGQSSKSSEKLGDVSVLAPEAYQEESMNQTIIDVRTPAEFSTGHVEGAINIDFFSDDFLEQIGQLDKSETLFIYCKSGNRSSKATPKILGLGFKGVVDLRGGIKNWNKSKQKLVK